MITRLLFEAVRELDIVFQHTQLRPIKRTYLPINSNISTTGHKLQGSTLDTLVVNSWTFSIQHWIYVVL